MAVYCGIDWAEGHHDVALVDDEGRLVAKRRITESLDEFAELATLMTEAGDEAEAPIPVAIETHRGLLVAALRAAGRSTRSTRWRWPGIASAPRCRDGRATTSTL